MTTEPPELVGDTRADVEDGEPSSTHPVGVDETADLSGRTATSLGWQYGAALLGATMQLVYTRVTSDQLSRREVGLFAAAMVVVNFTRYLSELGVGQALIQKAELTREDLRAGSTLGIGLGLVTWLLVAAAAAPLATGYFNKPDVTSVLRWLALAFVLTSMQTTAQSVLRRRLAFKQLAVIDVVSFFGGYIVLGCGAAYLGAGVWSLVLAVNGAAALSLVLRYALVRHPLVPVAGWHHYRPLLSFGTRISGVNFLNYASNNIDTIAVSRYATEALLGVYNRAFNAVTLSMSYLTQSLQRVLFPSMARIQDDPERLGRVFCRILGVVAFVLLPVAAGLAVAAEDVVGLVMGLPKWRDAVPLVPVLAVAAVAQGLSALVSAAAEARAELNRMLRIQVATLVGMVVGMWLVVDGVVLGGALVGYAVVLAVGEVVRHLLLLGVVRRSTGLTVGALAAAYLPALACSAITGVAIAGTRLAAVGLGLPVLVVLLLEAATGAVALVVLLRLGPVPRVRSEVAGRLHGLGVTGHGDDPRSRVVRAVLGPEALAVHAARQEG